jgi:hypothetical protein
MIYMRCAPGRQCVGMLAWALLRAALLLEDLLLGFSDEVQQLQGAGVGVGAACRCAQACGRARALVPSLVELAWFQRRVVFAGHARVRHAFSRMRTGREAGGEGAGGRKSPCLRASNGARGCEGGDRVRVRARSAYHWCVRARVGFVRTSRVPRASTRVRAQKTIAPACARLEPGSR